MGSTYRVMVLVLAAAAGGALAGQAQARAGGGVSVGHAAPAPAPARAAVTVPARAPTVPTYSAPPAPKPITQQRTTIINNAAPSGGGGGGGGFMSSFLGGAAGSVVGNALTGSSHAAPPPVMAMPGAVVVPAAVATQGASPMSSAVVVEREPLIGFWGLLLVLCAAGMGYAMWRAQRVRTAAHAEFVERRAAEAAFDPLGFFYQVQQAAMDGDRAMLGGICTGGLADVLAEAPEPGRRARLTLTGVTYRKVMGGYEYRFYDTVQKAQVVEQWVVTCHLLVGITVVEA